MQAGEVLMRLYRHRNNAVINNNGARNAALDLGREVADWVLPWDGNCFMTEEAWEKIVQSLSDQPALPYRTVPMARVTNNEDLLQKSFQPRDFGEPQIIFRADAPESFDPRFYYGRRPKVELLWRLGVPGPWDDWGIQPWDLPVPDFAPDASGWSEAGWVARLASGRPDLEFRVARPVERRRADVRSAATREFLDGLQSRWIEDRWSELSAAALSPVQRDMPLSGEPLFETMRSWPGLTNFWACLVWAEREQTADARGAAQQVLESLFAHFDTAGAREQDGAPLPGPHANAEHIQALVGLYWGLPAMQRLEEQGMVVPAGFGLWLEGLRLRLEEPGRLAARLRDSEGPLGFCGDLLNMAIAVYQRRSQRVAELGLATTCRLARLGQGQGWNQLSTTERLESLVVLSYLSELVSCFGVPLWGYPGSGESWMTGWLESWLEQHESQTDTEALVQQVVEGFRRHYGRWPAHFAHSLKTGAGLNPLVRPAVCQINGRLLESD